MTTSGADMLVTKLKSQLRLDDDESTETRQLLTDKIGAGRRLYRQARAARPGGGGGRSGNQDRRSLVRWRLLR